MRDLPTLSVVIPCRNEVAFVERAIRSVLASDYPTARLDITVVDGASDDGTRAVLARLAAEEPRVRIVSNPSRGIPQALNLGVRASKGEVVARLDAHSAVTPDYLRRCVKRLLDEPEAARVGGRIETRPQRDTPMGRAIASALASPIGVGGSRFRTSRDAAPVWVDTVPFWCAWRRALDDVGDVDERLARSEDIEYSRRMASKGHRTLLDPALVSIYYARSTLREFVAHAFLNGDWAIRPFKYVKGLPVSARHLMPLAFVLGLAALALGGLAWRPAWSLLAVACAAYMLVALAVGLRSALVRGEAALALLVPIAIAALHIAYGVGSLAGLARLGGRS